MIDMMTAQFFRADFYFLLTVINYECPKQNEYRRYFEMIKLGVKDL